MKPGRQIALTFSGAAFMAALFAASPAQATADSYARVLLPVEALMDEGYCPYEVLAYDAVTTAPHAYSDILSKVLVRPVNAFLYEQNEKYANDSIDLNVLSAAEPKLRLKITRQEDRPENYKIAVGIYYSARTEPLVTSETVEERIKLIFLYALRNIFDQTEDAKISFSIEDNVTMDDRLKRLSSRLTKQPHTKKSEAYLAIGKELDSKACKDILPRRK